MAGKGGILALLASPKGKGGSKGSPAPMGDMGEGDDGGELGGALREMFDALKAGDDAGAALAFKRAKSCCDEEHDEPDMDEFGGPSDGDMDNEE